jgi:hypothetical protein
VEYRAEDTGKCVTCGFAAKRRIDASSREYYEISKYERESQLRLMPVIVPAAGIPANRPAPVYLVCIRAVHDFPAIILQAVSGATANNQNQRIREVTEEELRNDRHCPAWYPYMPGLGPYEHLIEFRLQELKALWEKNELERESARRAFEERLERDRRHFDLKLVLFGLGIGAIFTLIQIGIELLKRDSFADRLVKWVFER